MHVSSAQRKLARGVEQIKTLYTEAGAFCRADAYVFTTDAEPRATYEVWYRTTARERIAPPEHWPLLAGEAIQSIRAALDHAVWAAWRSVPENAGGGEHTQFVICDDDRCFKKSRWRLQGVPAPVRSLVERSQPYQRNPEAPTRDPLWVLRTLSNTDKHRTLALVACAVANELIGVPTGVKVTDWEYAIGKELGSSATEVGGFVARSDRSFDPAHVTPHLSYDVRIERIPLELLTAIVRSVFQIVVECETGAPPHPLARYPL